MMKARFRSGVAFAPVVAAVALALAAPAAAADSGHAAAPAMQPDRLLTCQIGHVINFDKSHEQSAAELRYDGFHEFALFLPAIPVQTGRPPDAIDEAPPVDPRTRIVRDPDHISAQPNEHFGRIIDWWPDRVELSTAIDGPLLNAIVLRPIDSEHGTANMFMMRASELTQWQEDHIYQGLCHVVTGPAAIAAAGALGKPWN